LVSDVRVEKSAFLTVQSATFRKLATAPRDIDKRAHLKFDFQNQRIRIVTHCSQFAGNYLLPEDTLLHGIN
jgi:hypothetical protein